MNRKNPVTTPKVDNVKTVGTPDFNRNADGQKKKEDTKNDSKKREKLKNCRYSTTWFIYGVTARFTCFTSS